MQTSVEIAGGKVQSPSLLLSNRARLRQRIAAVLGNGFLLAVTSFSMLAVLFIFIFIARDALPFFQHNGLREFFTSTHWYPSAGEPEFGALAMFFGSAIVTFGAILVAVPLGIAAAVCLSDVIPFALRQFVKPIIEMLAAIPSVAYGFFALVVFAPLLQQQGGHLLAVAVWIIGLPSAVLVIIVLSDVAGDRLSDRFQSWARWGIIIILGSGALFGLMVIGKSLSALRIASGTNAFNVSIILGIMALPTIVSVSEDALQSVGRELREGSYALGATRAETIVKIVLPAARSGILAAVILGVMRAIGETMVVWMASGNASQIPQPWYNMLDPVRTLTATIAGDMGEADQVTGSSRYHVLFAMAFCLLVFSFVCNLVSERFIRRSRQKAGG
ncbi:MAG: phosphate ABC transporter permease subunit PstC [Kiritimatiellae bacterium]|nr:phosphate ABC transporter permease subunit PstC [Verrucomicrobiota bacterium]MBU4367185.1 phosphate ABC transporter permease subunit PstC [Verrucomicrobiota bacterium]MCG2660357.1 phosphate ABC transporter permease subunit PstC [Kiritimatiellia bacterium]